ncbi:hypothetical protein LX83_000680 [Goodfellowiella coeruleoviolacea]|uniref:ABC transporter ATP-binding protein n=1 Tax=Goodfellowiella coeruleoviolacea TaxID=334858 RepID=A0AAE3G948_9PSEU|nr:hypothetical protein [Goodfellowiella coeruleoviolacea]
MTTVAGCTWRNWPSTCSSVTLLTRIRSGAAATTSSPQAPEAITVTGLVALVLAQQAPVMVLHDLVSAARYADTLVAVRDGVVVAGGPPRDVVDPALVRRLYEVAGGSATRRAPVKSAGGAG